MEQKLISNLSEETLSLSSSLPQAVLCLLNDLIIPLLLFLLILIYYAYALPLLTVNLSLELRLEMAHSEM